MISVVIVSRNDGYGYELEKRTVFSLNLWAMELSIGNGDEIVFIDDNTEAGKPTLPEAVKKWLYPRTLAMLRVLKVTPEVHAQFGVSIPVAENHCRNIGIRQARNPWVASSTNDNFPTRLYPNVLELDWSPYVACPRRVPIPTWAPINSVSLLYKSCVFAEDLIPISEPLPADRQWLIHRKGGDLLLCPKEILVDVRGFEEGMKDFGHGESNVMRKTMARAYRNRSLLERGIGVFHLEHSTEESPVHFLDGHKLNDFDHWCQNFWRTENPDTWGQWPVEEVSLG